MKTFLASLFALSLTASAAQEPSVIDYRFDQVKRTVTLTTAKQALKVASGQTARSGDRVQTGWFSYALIASDTYRAKFEIFASTDVQLADGTPGVVLSLERGRLRALFDKITGSEPRVVKTPGALLAVRGTSFDVEVDVHGNTVVDVLEGIVELRSERLPEPMMLRPGQSATYGRHDPPTMQPTPARRSRDGRRGVGPDAGDPHDGGHGDGGKDGHHQPGGGTPPPSSGPPPKRPPA